MSRSVSYYLVELILRLKGIKKAFLQSPVDFKKLRKDDLKNPPSSYLKNHNSDTFMVLESCITEITQYKNSSKLIIFVPGGAFVSGPGKHHWDTVEKISKQTDFTIWLCDYPKAPEHKITQISENIDAVYTRARKYFKPENIILLGDSVGGTLITALVMRLSKQNMPAKIIVVCPVMDAKLDNPEIDVIDKTDPMLSKRGVQSAKVMAMGAIDLSDPRISPVNGKFESFPPIVLFIATNDITSPDQEIFAKKICYAKVPHIVYRGLGMPHIWPFLPLMKESGKALSLIIDEIKTA